MLIRRGRAAVYGAAGLLMLLTIAGSVLLEREQWQNELSGVRNAIRADVEGLSSLLAEQLRLGQYGELPKLVRTWGQTDPMIAEIRLQAPNGYLLAGIGDRRSAASRSCRPCRSPMATTARRASRSRATSRRPSFGTAGS